MTPKGTFELSLIEYLTSLFSINYIISLNISYCFLVVSFTTLRAKRNSTDTYLTPSHTGTDGYFW